MNDYRLSQRADADLDDIFEYTVERLGLNQSSRYLESLNNCFAMLAEHPRIGRTAEAIGPGLRRHEHGSHVIFYREERDLSSLLRSSTEEASTA